jgi:hypothetical protein
MKILLGSRRIGKTTQVVRTVLKEEGYLLVHSEREKERLLHQYPTLEGKIYCYHDFPSALCGREDKPLYLDNLDLFLLDYFDGRLKGATAIFQPWETIKEARNEIKDNY